MGAVYLAQKEEFEKKSKLREPFKNKSGLKRPESAFVNLVEASLWNV
jgi:hypothetical protein